jgi:hypothetical protein
MTVIIPHNKTKEEAIRLVDSQADHLFEVPGGGSVALSDHRKSWEGSAMDFSVTASAGFISLPISGRVNVDDTNVTVNVQLPALVSRFIGEDKIRAGVEGRVRGMLSA